MFLAAKEGCCESVRTLLNYYANREITDHLDRQPRDIANERMHRDIVKLLVEYPVDLPVSYVGQHTPAMYAYQQHATVHRNGSLQRHGQMNGKPAKRRARKPAATSKAKAAHNSMKQPSTVALPDGDHQTTRVAKSRKKKAALSRNQSNCSSTFGACGGGVDLPPSYDQACSTRAIEGGHYSGDILNDQVFEPEWSTHTSHDQQPTNQRLMSDSSTNGLTSCSGELGSPLSSMTGSPPSHSDVISSPLASNYSPCGAAHEMSPQGSAAYNSSPGAHTLSPQMMGMNQVSPHEGSYQSSPTHLQAMQPQLVSAQPQCMHHPNVYSPPTQGSPASAQLMHINNNCDYDRQLQHQCVPEQSFPTPPSHHGQQGPMDPTIHPQPLRSTYPTPSPESLSEWSSDPQSSPPEWSDNTHLNSASRHVNRQQLSAFY